MKIYNHDTNRIEIPPFVYCKPMWLDDDRLIDMLSDEYILKVREFILLILIFFQVFFLILMFSVHVNLTRCGETRLPG